MNNKIALIFSSYRAVMCKIYFFSIFDLGSRAEGPSIFECQLKIFGKWYTSWSPADRSDFAVQMNAVSPEFIAAINAQLQPGTA